MNELPINKSHFLLTAFLLIFSLATASSKEPASVIESLLGELTRLQAMGADRAIPVLLETCRPASMEDFYTRGKGHEMDLDIPINSLCRLLFQAKKNNSFLPPPYSAYYFGKQQGKHWPLNPYTKIITKTPPSPPSPQHSEMD